MSNEQDKPQPERESDFVREIRQARKFTAEEAIGRLAGPGAMKGASPISQQQQAENAVGNWLRDNVMDSAGALKAVLYRHLKGSELLLENLACPSDAAVSFCRRLLASDDRLKEIVWESDVEWGRAMGERPYFEREGRSPHPDDPYTIECVRKALRGAVAKSPG